VERSRIVRRRVDLVAVGLGLAVFVPCALVARDGRVEGWEVAVFEAINGLSDRLSPAMQGAQLLGVLAIGPVAAVVAAAFRRWRLAIACLIVTAGKLAAERIVWELVQRSRPGTTVADAIVRGDTPSAGASFVSGHVILVVGLAWVVTPRLRGRWRLVPAVVVALVAFARVYLGAHAPLDVVGGLGIGLVVGGVASLAVGVRDGSGFVATREGADNPGVSAT
jgi:membrane-associated phospholipid phosphatase